MDTFRPSNSAKNAYIQRTLSAQNRNGSISGVSKLMREGSGVGADLFRHAMLVVGVVGLVGIAAGALTGSTYYETVLGWVTSLFVK